MISFRSLPRIIVKAWPSVLSIFAGIYVLGIMLAQARPGYFYSVDGGFKYLMIQQYLKGDFSTSLPSSRSALQQALWDAGCYPYTPPYVFTKSSDRVPAFPLYFPLLTTPFVKLFGFYGLHILPVIGLVATWILLAVAARRHRFGRWPVLMGMLSLTIASPLTIYGALFWEHSLAAFFAAIPIVVLMPDERLVRPKTAMLAGIAAGLGVFLRPEMLPLLPILVLLAALFRERAARPVLICFGTGVTLSFAAFFALNTVFYSHPLGCHVLNVVGEERITPSFWTSLFDRTPDLIMLFAKHFPFGVAFLFFAFWPAFRQSRRICYLASSLPLILVGIALIVPNNGGLQWGPRYFLPLVPWFSYAVMAMLARLRQTGSSPLCISVTSTIIIHLLWCVNENTRNAFYHLQYYNHISYGPSISFLAEAKETHFVFPDSCSANWAFLDQEKEFYRCAYANDINNLVHRLKEHGVNSCLYVSFHLTPPCHPGYSAEPLEHDASEVVIYRLSARTTDP